VATRRALVRLAEARLRAQGVEDPRLEAELLLGAALGVRRLDLHLDPEAAVPPEAAVAFEASVERRLRGEPLQYVLGETEFRELRLRVDRRVLIPRPETEVLVEEVLRWAAGRRDPAALDVGTGSGAIALSLAREGRFRRIVATDVSAAALEVARENAERLGLADRVEFREGPLFEPVRGERFDVVVSNPPYISEAERPFLPREVREWEPAVALFAGEEGLAVLAALVREAPLHLEEGGLLALEVGLGQAAEVVRRLEAAGRYGPPRVVRDLAGRDRVVLAPLAALAEDGAESQHVGHRA